MKKKQIRILWAIVLLLGISGILFAGGPRPMLLENDPAGDDAVFLPDAPVPLAPGPEALAAEDPYAGLDETQIQYVQEVLTLVNEARESRELPPLELDASLRQAAQVRATECGKKFSHTRPDGSSYKTAIAEAGIETGYAGENVANGHTSPEHVMKGWMRSSGHKANILNKNYTKIGIGLMENTSGAYGGYVWAQLFIQ